MGFVVEREENLCERSYRRSIKYGDRRGEGFTKKSTGNDRRGVDRLENYYPQESDVGTGRRTKIVRDPLE